LIREGHKLIRKGTIPYLHDLYDHVIRVIESVEGFHDALSGLFDIYLSSVSNRMNEIMKVLTVISTIFIKSLRWIPPSLLGGGKRGFAVGEFCRYHRWNEPRQTSQACGLRPQVPLCLDPEVPKTGSERSCC